MCQVAKQLGCKSIELVEPKDWPILKKYGLVCALAGSHWFEKGMNNPAYQQECLAKMRQAIDDCAEFGFPNVITFTGLAEDIPPDEGMKNCVAGYKKIIGYAEKKKVNLIDYERIVDENNRRLIFFGKYAGLAGMVETLHGIGQKLKMQGFETPLEKIRQAYEYSSVEDAKGHIAKIGGEIEESGFPPELAPFVFAFAGYGNGSQGAQEIFDLLPFKSMSIDVLDLNFENFAADNHIFYKIILREEDLVKRKEGRFDLEEYYNHPELYVSKFEEYAEKLKVLVNCIYWTEKYPRLLTKKYLRDQASLIKYPNLRMIGDISCDIDGSIEITHKVTMPDNTSFTYFGNEDRFEDGIQAEGVSVMAVDNLPCEFPRESSGAFSEVLLDFVDGISGTDFNSDFGSLTLPDPAKRALILHRGELTDDYKYMRSFIQEEE